MKRILFAAALAVIVGFAAPAMAQQSPGLATPQGYQPSAGTGCCYDYGNANGNTSQVISSFTQQINAMQLAIIEALRLGTGQLTGNLREQTTAGHNMADIQDDRSVVGRVEQARLDAISQAASGQSTCNVMTSASGGALGASVEGTRVALSTQLTNWGTGTGDSPTGQGPDRAVQKRLGLHCSKFASQADQMSGLCPSGGSAGVLENADVSAGKSLFYADPTTGADGDLPPQQVAAAQAFIVNTINPTPNGRMRTGEGATAQGRDLAARQNSSEARTSVAGDLAHFLLAQVNPAQSGVAQVTTTAAGSQGAMSTQTWAAQTAPLVIGYTNRTYPNGLSWYDWMDLRSRAWFQNTVWMASMDTATEVQAVKDSTVMMSFMVLQNWENYRLQRRIAMTLATLLAIQVDANKRQ